MSNAFAPLFAARGGLMAWDLGQMLIVAVVIIGLIAVGIIILREVFKVEIPPWVIKIAWIVGGCLVAVVAIRFLLGLL